VYTFGQNYLRVAPVFGSKLSSTHWSSQTPICQTENWSLDMAWPERLNKQLFPHGPCLVASLWAFGPTRRQKWHNPVSRTKKRKTNAVQHGSCSDDADVEHEPVANYEVERNDAALVQETSRTCRLSKGLPRVFFSCTRQRSSLLNAKNWAKTSLFAKCKKTLSKDQPLCRV